VRDSRGKSTGDGLATAALSYCLLALIANFSLVQIARSGTQEMETIADVQCVVVGASFSTSSDQKQRAAGEVLLAYFLGRIRGRQPKIDLEPLLEKEAKKMDVSSRDIAASRCSAELAAQGAEISRIGKKFGQLGR
jgi:hypothetical protein